MRPHVFRQSRARAEAAGREQFLDVRYRWAEAFRRSTTTTATTIRCLHGWGCSAAAAQHARKGLRRRACRRRATGPSTTRRPGPSARRARRPPWRVLNLRAFALRRARGLALNRAFRRNRRVFPKGPDRRVFRPDRFHTLRERPSALRIRGRYRSERFRRRVLSLSLSVGGERPGGPQDPPARSRRTCSWS